MGELAVSSIGGATLVTIGLGSCIGLVLADGGVAGLAHVVLPTSNGHSSAEPGKFADLAVPALLDAVLAAGAARTRLSAMVVGGAHMFSFAGGASELDIGGRNRERVFSELERRRIPVAAEATGGDRGRTVRVYPEGGLVVVKEAGGKQFELSGELRRVA